MLQFLEGRNIFNSMNMSLPYNDVSGANYTAASTVVQTFLCPSATRQPDGGRDATGDPNGMAYENAGPGYGVNDYAATIATDIDPQGIQFNTACSNSGATQLTPYRNNCSRADELLHQGKTRSSGITDGTSNTVAMGEDAGRDARFPSPYIEGYQGNRIMETGSSDTESHANDFGAGPSQIRPFTSRVRSITSIASTRIDPGQGPLIRMALGNP